MANCIKYGKNTYKPNILFDKIRSNPEFFAKKHGITGSDVEGVLGIAQNDNIDFQIPTPQKPKNLMPKSLIANIADSIRNGGKGAEVMNIVNNSNWFKGLGESTKANMTFNDVKATLIDSDRYHKENDSVKAKAKADARVEREKENTKTAKEKTKEAKAKTKEVRENYEDKILNLRADYKQRIAQLKDENKTLRQKQAERKAIIRSTVIQLKSLLIGNGINGIVTPTETTRLIRLASEIGASKKPTEALNKFFEVYADIQERAEARLQASSNRKLDKDEYEQLKDIVTDLIDNNTGSAIIIDIVKDLDLPFSRKNTISKEVLSTIERITERYETDKLSESESRNLSDKAYEESKDNKNSADDSRTRLQKIGDGLKKSLVKTIEMVSDRQFTVKELLNNIGALNTYNRLINSAGSSAKASEIHSKSYDKIFKGLNQEHRELLDKVIVARRIIAIEKNRSDRDLAPIQHPNGMTLESAKKTLVDYENEFKEVYTDVNNRATEYFKVFNNQLDEMFRLGLISQEAYDGMNGIEYQPRLFLEHIADYQGNVEENIGGDNYNVGRKAVGRNVVQNLDEGSVGKMAMNADWILRVAIASNTKMTAMNEVNAVFMTKELPQKQAEYEVIKAKDESKWTKEEKSFLKHFETLRAQVQDNPIMYTTPQGNPKYKTDTTPTGFTKNYYYVNGVRNEFFIADELHNMWNDVFDRNITKAAESHWLSKGIFLMPTQLTKTMATGINPLFAITNTPRDFFQVLNFTDAYSNITPVGIAQLAKDTFKAWADTRRYSKGEADTMYARYIQYGGGMDFLATQGKFDKKYADRNALFGALDTINTLSKYSEIGFRIATFSRTSQNDLKAYNKENGTNYKTVEEIPNEYDRDNIYHNAVRTARAVMDFNQGGKSAKDLDSFLPYLNASIQGTRSMVDAMRKRPYSTSFKMVQTATYMTGLTFGLMYSLFALFDDDDDEKITDKIIDAYDRITPTQRANNWNIILPNALAEKLGFALPIKKNKKDYYVFKIAKTQTLSPLLYMMEEGLLNVMKSTVGRQPVSFINIGKEATGIANKNMLPFQLAHPLDMVTTVASKSFIGKAFIASKFGHDTYRDELLSYDIGKVPKGAEGLSNPNVEDFYKNFGKSTGYSPVRTKAIVEGLITSPQTNPYVMVAYGGANVLTNLLSNEDKEIVSGRMKDDVKKMFAGRLVSQTSEYAKSLRTKDDKVKDNEAVDYQKAERDAFVKETANARINGTVTPEYVNEKIAQMKLTENETKNIIKRINERIDNKDIDSELFTIKYAQTTSEGKAKRLIEAYPNIDLRGNTKEAIEIKQQLDKIGGLATKDVTFYYNKLMDEKLKKQKEK